MALEDPLIYTIFIVITLFFTVFAIIYKESKIILKIIAGTCWFIMAILQFIIGGADSALTTPLSVLWSGLGIILFLSTVNDWQGEKKDRFGKEIES